MIWAVNRFMHELPEGVEIVNLVHDEVDAIVTRETLEATVEVITRAFQQTFAGFYPSSELVPDVKFSCGPSWGETVPIDGTGGLSFSSSRKKESALLPSVILPHRIPSRAAEALAQR